MQQRASTASIAAYIAQFVGLRNRQALHTTFSYPCVARSNNNSKSTHLLSVLVFPDAGRQAERSQLSYIARLLMRNIETGSPLHPMSWFSNKFCRPVKLNGLPIYWPWAMQLTTESAAQHELLYIHDAHPLGSGARLE